MIDTAYITTNSVDMGLVTYVWDANNNATITKRVAHIERHISLYLGDNVVNQFKDVNGTIVWPEDIKSVALYLVQSLYAQHVVNPEASRHAAAGVKSVKLDDYQISYHSYADKQFDSTMTSFYGIPLLHAYLLILDRYKGITPLVWYFSTWLW